MQLFRTVSRMRFIMMFLGIFLIGLGVSAFRLSAFGVDPFTCMNLGISGYLHMSFGTWQLLMNLLMLVVVFFTVRKYIGLGTIINMVFVGYTADFFCWIVTDCMKIVPGIGLRIVFLCVGMLCVSLGAAKYMMADLGIAPYDAVAYIIEKATKEKISFRMGRVLSDVTVMTVGIVACLASGDNVWLIVGVGTILNSLLNGPLIQFFKEHLPSPVKTYQ